MMYTAECVCVCVYMLRLCLHPSIFPYGYYVIGSITNPTQRFQEYFVLCGIINSKDIEEQQQQQNRKNRQTRLYRIHWLLCIFFYVTKTTIVMKKNRDR